MDPQEEIAAYLRSKGVQRAVLNDMLRGFAHDLAEAQRTFADERYGLCACKLDYCTRCDVSAVIDYIDPGVVRPGDVSP